MAKDSDRRLDDTPDDATSILLIPASLTQPVIDFIGTLDDGEDDTTGHLMFGGSGIAE